MLYTIKLEKFEGPLDLLLSLIEEQKLDICEISLAQVADQYIKHIKVFQEMKPRDLVEFLVVVAKLILIKSRALMPFLKLSEGEEEEIGDLEARLKEYKKFKELAKKLKPLYARSGQLYSRESFAGLARVFLPPKNISAFDLSSVLLKIINAIPQKEILPEEQIEKIVSIEEKIKDIQNRIKNAALNFSELAKEAESKIDVIVSFLAALELVRHNFVLAEQTEVFGEIKITRIKEEEFSFINLS